MHSLNRRSLLQFILGSLVSTGEVSTPLGRVQGTENDDARIFLGVPFAQPPVGNLRFRAPLPARPWTGVLQAIQQPPAPMQAGSARMSEDCLYLNIFAPKTPGPHPVVVWIYGGGNNAGSVSNLDGSVFARDGVVVSLSITAWARWDFWNWNAAAATTAFATRCRRCVGFSGILKRLAAIQIK